jgi:hypothetical protein
MTAAPGPQPPANTPLMQADGRPTLAYLQYLLALDKTVRSLTGNLLGAPVQLTNAANDAAAAAAGVAIGQLYRNGSVVQIRVT